MTKKFFSILLVMFTVLMCITNVHAADGLFHTGIYEDIYKLSEQAEIDLPFFNMFVNAATYDKDVKHSGISFGSTTIDVNEKLEGMHVILSTDMVTIKGEVENSFIYANNVVIEGKLTSDSIILAPTVQIKENAIIENDVIIIANNLEIAGNVKGNLIATVTDKTTVSGKVDKDLRLITTDLALNNEQIKGDIYVETTTDMSLLKEKYPNAVVKDIIEPVEQETDWMGIITNGIITVVVYTFVAWLLTRKDNNIVRVACEKFKANTTFGLIASVITLMLILILPMILILLALTGLGLIAWPILIAYIALLLLVATTAMLIVGMAIYDAIKCKVIKFRIPVIALIYVALYTLTQITFVAGYANMAIMLVALAIVIAMFTKKKEAKEPVNEDKK